jgi:hypothetical protein
MARATGGRSREVLQDVWRELPRLPRWVELAPWLLGLSVAFFLLEVLERRSGLLAARRRKPLPAPDRREGESGPEPQPPAAAPAPPRDEPGVLDALRDARERARGRTAR